MESALRIAVESGHELEEFDVRVDAGRGLLLFGIDGGQFFEGPMVRLFQIDLGAEELT